MAAMLRSTLKVPVGFRSDASPLGAELVAITDGAELVVKHTFLEFVEVATPVGRQRIRASTDPAMIQTGGGACTRRDCEGADAATIREGDASARGAEGGEDGGTSDAESASTTDQDESTTDGSDGAPARTTLMMRNLPNNYTRSMLLAMLDGQGFAGCYNFVYLPIDFGSSANLGYAFINLVNAGVVQRFWHQFNGFSDWDIPSSKVCHVDWSGPHQGLEAHIERYRNSPMMHKCVPDGYKPIIFEGGVRVPFPTPTKALQPPRARRPDAYGGRRRFMVVRETSPTEVGR